MNRKKYFPTDDEEDIHLRDDTEYSRHRSREGAGDPRRLGKGDYGEQARSKDPDTERSQQSEKITPSQTKFRHRGR